MSLVASRADSELPAVDDRLVEPETRYEIHDGELVYVSPADAPHAERHVQIAALLEAHTGPGFEVAADLLTRTSPVDDIAPDVSVYPEPAPGTAGGELAQLAFEIVSTQSLGRAGGKAAKLAARGVRRVFAIDVERSRVLEWSVARGAWCELVAEGHIEDPTLEVALPIAAMIHAARTDDAVARALVARHNPVIEAVRAQDRASGKLEGKLEGLIAILTARGIALDSTTRERIVCERDPQRLDRWIARAATSTTITEVLADG
jgi:Uma2 family endonuclease